MTSDIFRKGPPKTERTLLESIVKSKLTENVESKRNGRIYGSEAGFCSRMSAINGSHPISDDVTAAGRFYMGIGVAIHDLVKEAFVKANMTVYEEYHLPEIGINLGGYVDIIIMHQGEPHIIEVKSCGRLPSVAKPQHEAQAALYGAVLGIPATLMYVSRNVNDFFGNLLVKAIPVSNSDETRRAALFNATLAHLSIKHRVVPSKTFETDSNCSYCRFHSLCWGSASPNGYRLASPLKESRLRLLAANMTDDLLAKTGERYAAFMSEMAEKIEKLKTA